MPDPVWKRLLAEPERALEVIALEAAERFAGPAERWARTEGAGKRPDKLAKAGYRRHVHLSRAEGLALGIGGIVTSAANLAALAWIQARMVFFIAAAYGCDPHDRMRPAELLVLWEVYDSPAEARAALDGLGRPMAQTLVENRLADGSDRTLTQRLMRYVGRRVVKRAGGRLIPLLGAPISAIQNGGSTKELGSRALEFYARQAGAGHG